MNMELTAQYIADHIGGEISGDPGVKVSSVARIESAKPNTLAFLGNPKYESFFYTCRASIIIVNKTFEPSKEVDATLIKVEDAYRAIAAVLELFDSLKSNRKIGRSFGAKIAWSAKTGKGCYIGTGAVISKKAVIGSNTQIYPQCYIGDGAEVGSNTILYPGVKIYAGCKVGSNCIIHANAVIGADGFGFAPMEDGTYKKIPQTGNVVIEDNCEIGANTTIDKASIGSTIIREGVKIDNLVMIAHNVEIGKNTVIAGQTGFAGSVRVGEGCMFGGQVGVAGHISIANKTIVGAQAGLMSSVKEEGKTLLGSPALDAKEYMKAYAIFRKLHKR